MKKKWYKGKTFVITGASGDIGSEVCRKFAPLGLRMYLLDLMNPKLNDLVSELGNLGAEHVEAIEMDVTNQEQIKSTFDYIGKTEGCIDILHNNAGIGGMVSITNGGSFDDYRKIMSINVDGMWLVLQAALPYIGRAAPTKKNPERKQGQLIFTSSSAGKTGIPNMAAYSMSKHAVVGLADSIRREFEMLGHDIQVICVCPAPARTKFWASDPELEKWVEQYQQKGLLYKFIEAEDVANRILKASRKYKKEIYVPRYWWLIPFLQMFSHHTVGKLLIKIEEAKKDMPSVNSKNEKSQGKSEE
ncbi:MAG: SDR family NAD(P)-dependent oxidoreductase [Candidatus Lokiarchaeota archaeon]|nr:SDR family NAD(P)-dependent oxidoreductase [Candidatus Lokiarchaeota archaeon]MBD3198571.1 SDR family NAD(P)-dependent oxidoreductase [Candidatus Lokiarchaeota archaeon]